MKNEDEAIRNQLGSPQFTLVRTLYSLKKSFDIQTFCPETFQCNSKANNFNLIEIPHAQN